MQTLPASGPAREALREKGRFWTPRWLAEVMAAWVLGDHPAVLFDPAVGPGTFFSAARGLGFTGIFTGFELDRAALEKGIQRGLPRSELQEVRIGDFICSLVTGAFPAIISNPPCIRHHRLNRARKDELRLLGTQFLGFPLDGRAGLHLYFLLKCLAHLAPGGRLAFVLPADVCEGVSSSALWRRLTEKFRLDAVLVFTPEAAPFPGVDTNAMVFLLSKRAPASEVLWLQVSAPDPGAILAALQGQQSALADGGAVTVHRRDLQEALATGLSRPPRVPDAGGVPLSHFARVLRGIATGANEFFFLSSAQMREHGLAEKFFVRAIGRTRDCAGDTLSRADLERLDQMKRPTWLLNLGKEPFESLPAALRAYLETGEKLGLPDRALIQTRKPWYRMEQRTPPALLFAYLGRRDCRFILNRAGALPLTGFLCVYPWEQEPQQVRLLWRALNHPDTLANLVFVGKSYGDGALKVEPRQLESLEIPGRVVQSLGLVSPPRLEQMALLERLDATAASPTRTNSVARIRKGLTRPE